MAGLTVIAPNPGLFFLLTVGRVPAESSAKGRRLCVSERRTPVARLRRSDKEQECSGAHNFSRRRFLVGFFCAVCFLLKSLIVGSVSILDSNAATVTSVR